MPAGYRVLSLVYDRWQSLYPQDYSALILPRLRRTLRSHPPPERSIVDVACGTGTLAILMAQAGWRATGIDASRMQIAAARAKARDVAPRPRFQQDDMRSFRLPARAGVATSFFDSLNHLPSDRDLLRTFRCVARALLPGGLFVFDLNNEHCYRTLWNATGVAHHPDFTLILENHYAPARKKGHSFVTLFLREGNRHRELGEIVQERYFPDATVRTLLEQSGFEFLRLEEFNFTGQPAVGNVKSWWVARKRS